MRSRFTLALAVGTGVACGAADAFAHGGSHPTPWPSPGTPTPGSRPRPNGPRGTGPRAPSSSSWKTWWELNKWIYTSVARRSAIRSGKDAPPVPTQAERNAARTELTDWLLRQCGHDFFDVRSAAALALGKSGDTAAAPKLLAMIEDSHADVRESAVLALGLLRDARQVPAVTERGLEAAGKGSAHHRLRSAAALALGFIGSKTATPALVQQLEHSREPEVRYGCIAALGLMRDSSGLPVLYGLLNGHRVDEKLRAHAATAIGKSGLSSFELTRDGRKRRVDLEANLARWMRAASGEHLLRQSCVQALGALGASGRIREVENTMVGDKREGVRNFAAIALARLAKQQGGAEGTMALARLTKILEKGKHGERGFAALAIGILGDPRGAAPLRRAFTSESDPSLRSAAAVGLGVLRAEDAAVAIEGALIGTKNAELRGYCCIALGLIGRPGSAKLLRSTIERELVPEVRAAAAIALASMGDYATVPHLLRSLKEKSNYIKQSTIVALGYFRDTRTIGPIRAVFEDPKSNNEVRAICVVALGYIIDRFDRPVFKELAVDFNHHLPGEMVQQVLKLF